jgi:hypothetical protein
VILSSQAQDKSSNTTTIARLPSAWGSACASSCEGKGAASLRPGSHLEQPWTLPAYAGDVFGCVSSAPRGSDRSFGFSFGGVPGLEQARRRMPTAPLTLDPSATQQEGGP